MGIITNEFVISARGNIVRLLRLIGDLKGSIVYSDVASGFARLRFRGSPCSNEYTSNVAQFMRESRDLVNSCKCLSTYVSRLRISDHAGSRELASVKSCASRCISLGSKVLCEKRVGDFNLLLEVLVTLYSLRIRAYPVSFGEHLVSTLSSLRKAIPCDESLIRKLLSIMCELEKCLSGV